MTSPQQRLLHRVRSPTSALLCASAPRPPPRRLCDLLGHCHGAAGGARCDAARAAAPAVRGRKPCLLTVRCAARGCLAREHKQPARRTEPPPLNLSQAMPTGTHARSCMLRLVLCCLHKPPPSWAAPAATAARRCLPTSHWRRRGASRSSTAMCARVGLPLLISGD